MDTFTFNEEAYKKYVKKWTIALITIMVVYFVTVILTNSFQGGHFDLLTFLITSVLIAVFLGISFYRRQKKQQQILSSYSVHISDNEITRQQLHTLPLTINFMEVKEIIKSKRGAFSIKGRDKRDVIFIPHWINDSEALEQRLATFAPITFQARPPVKKFAPLIAMILVAVLVVLVLSGWVTDKIFIAVTGIATIGFLGWLLYELQVNKNVPVTAKRRSWLFLLSIAAILYAIYQKFMH